MVAVNLISKQTGKIKEFFCSCYPAQADIDDDIVDWIYIYRSPEEAEAVIEHFKANAANYGISMWVRHSDNDPVQLL